jgi:hypothetical protein
MCGADRAPAKYSEALFHHRHFFDAPWADKWISPNPFLVALAKPLRADGVELTGFSFNKEASNVGETYLNVSIRKLNAEVRVAIDNVTFIASNPNWEMAPQLARLFEGVANLIQEVVARAPASQDAVLALHVMPGLADFRLNSAALINPNLSNEAQICGVTVHRRESTLVIDKSLRYPTAAFVRLQRRFAGDAEFSAVAKQMYEDEVSALRLLGLPLTV